MIERPVEIPSGPYRLSGTYCAADSSLPQSIVLMIHGSGPLDRDENFGTQRLDVFNTIAHHLAGAGIASVRYDKRGCGASTGDYHTTGFCDLISDAVRVMDWIRKTYPEVSLYLLGHSEGCLIAPHAALRRPDIAGLILLCPFVERMESVLMRQAVQIERELARLPGIAGTLNRLAARLFGTPTATQRKLIARLRSTKQDTSRVGLRRFPDKWLRELLDVDPESVFRQIDHPMLLIGGAKDVQCLPEDVSRIAALSPAPIESHVLEDLTHLLRCDDGPPSLMGSRRLPDKPIEPAILDLILRWVCKHR
ncbi:MAG: alpha/beta fold hydrolase [Candidatus Hydrogenedens sp.]|nr:alpha/beta fold hydrolase [Candidatus Hydrogenedens sp.]